MSDVTNNFRVTMDSMVENCINVHLEDKTILKFSKVGKGLYILQDNFRNNLNKRKVSDYSFLTLVKSNKAKFTKREVKMVDKAKDLYRKIVLPRYNRYIKAVTNGSILNCPINVDDIKRSIHIYGPDIIGLKGKDTRRRPKPLGLLGNIPLPRDILKHHKEMMISMNYVFVHGLPHLYSNSRGYAFRTIEYMPGKKPTKNRVLRGQPE